MIQIDGAKGEGGGQIVRTALGLSLVTGSPFRIQRIRAGRKKPGLLRQHLTAVRAAATLGDAEVSGDALSSSELTFRPRTLRGGEHTFSIGSAGSTSLVLQTILPGLLCAPSPSQIAVEGGTHNPLAPPFEFLDRAFGRALAAMGADVSLRLDAHGFYPAGGGRLSAQVVPSKLSTIAIETRGALTSRSAHAFVSAIPSSVAERELSVIEERLGFSRAELHPRSIRAHGPGNALVVELSFENVTEVFVNLGERGVSAESVASRLCGWVESYLVEDAPVGPHLADQLLLPMALAGGGVFRTGKLTEHTRTQIDLLPQFLGVAIQVTEERSGRTNRIQVVAK